VSFKPINDNLSFRASCTPNDRPRPALKRNITADLAIIGGQMLKWIYGTPLNDELLQKIIPTT